ncbi:MAG: hypothetical protein N2235_16650 [Fischerella sp.]|nr:hypothetical protein [Fischerella sp.]
MGWVFPCLMSIHPIAIAGWKHIVNLTQECALLKILSSHLIDLQNVG